eukprot:CAMPEP_0196573706 /NCGR_PEP_ID=MMETSP1081-20130531/3568_1 /TAXON_ID=36882 /ORGANISM="Pyramimonas amylifera, Strain CCMP720" /LENGTH=91 /DNA_ID=CAMNT_0041891521 /DNA_START=81 /DNA_END=356 /DNA_ORIENTATION=+
MTAMVHATKNTSTLPGKVKEFNTWLGSHNVDASEKFPIFAEVLLFTLEEFFQEGEFTPQIEGAWISVIGVIDQLILDPNGDFFFDPESETR